MTSVNLDTPPQPPAQIPSNIAETMRFISEWFELTRSMLMDAHKRLDELRDRQGVYHEQYTEAFSGMRERVEALERLPTLVEMHQKMLNDIMPQVDARFERAASIAEHTRAEFGQVAARFQQAITELHDDQDERFAGLRAETSARVANVEAELTKRKAAENGVTQTRIIARKDIVVAFITVVMGGLVSGVVAIVIALTSQ